MNKRNVITFLCFTISILLIACQAPSTPKEVLYENPDVGLIIYESSEWDLDNESNTDVFHASFSTDNVKANISILPGNRQMEEIKNEVFLEDFMTVLEETDTYLSLKTNKEGIQTDIYREEKNNKTILIAFVATEIAFETSKDILEEFKNNIEIIK